MKRMRFLGSAALSVLLVFIMLISWVKLGEAADGKIVVGMVEAMSGPFKASGDRFALAVKYAVDEINVVGEKDQDFILFGIIELNAAKGIGLFLKSFHPLPFDQFIFENIAVLGNLFSPTTSYKAFSFIRVRK